VAHLFFRTYFTKLALNSTIAVLRVAAVSTDIDPNVDATCLHVLSFLSSLTYQAINEKSRPPLLESGSFVLLGLTL
jgi:hypothetical protein